MNDTETVRLDFPTPPSVLSLLPKALLRRRPALAREGLQLPRIEVRAGEVRLDPAHVERYNAVCGFADPRQVPVTYPHVLAASLHLALLTAETFPVRLFGLVHLRNTITQYSPLPLEAAVGLRCHVEGLRETERGQEFDVISEVRSGDSVLWEETMTLLARRRGGGAKARPRAPAEDELGAARTVSFAVPADIGRRYAPVAGDFNPIHLSMPSARLFGFPRAIAHGMWSLARSVAEVSEGEATGRVRLDCAFKLPVLLPGWVMLRYAGADGGGIRFELRDRLGEKPHLSGRLIQDQAH